MTRYQLLLLTICLTVSAVLAEPAGHVRRQRFNGQRLRFLARQEAAVPTPYPLASELKPDEPALIYGPPQGNEEQEPEPTVTLNPQAEELDTEDNSLEVTTQSFQPARLRQFGRQRLAKLQIKSTQRKSARLEELPLEGEIEPVAAVAPAAAPAVVPAAVAPAVINPALASAALPAAVPQFYYVGAPQQPYTILAYSASPSGPQQLAW
ncbi:translation initiation factor IF-2 [Drosophila tropicalis]|uniref:translation initiation factor IF-2 n=1 Tax=Drosophila tropicalis TaxID=46794 RepID=UPI0035AC0822